MNDLAISLASKYASFIVAVDSELPRQYSSGISEMIIKNLVSMQDLIRTALLIEALDHHPLILNMMEVLHDKYGCAGSAPDTDS
jgi:hypothetical protein